MIRKFYSKTTSSVQGAAILLAFSGILAMLLGLLRDKLLAHFIGPTVLLDVYYSAFRIPDIIFNTVATLFSVSILMPFLTNYISSNDENGGRRFIRNSISTFCFLMVVVCGIAYFLMPFLSAKLVANFSPEMQILYIKLARILLLSPILLGLSNLFATVTEYYRHFIVWSFAPLFYNLGIVCGILFYPKVGIFAVAGGVLLGALMHLVIQIPIIIKYKYLRFKIPKISLVNYRLQEMLKVFKTALPRVISLSLNNLVMLVLIAVAARLSVGSVSVFTFSYTIQSVPMTVLALAFSVAVFSNLARYHGLGQFDEFKKEFTQTARKVFALTLVTAIVFLVFRYPLVDFLLGSGAFTGYHTVRVASLVFIAFFGIVPAGIVQLYLRTLYATGDTKRPFFATVTTAITTLGITILGISLFKNTDLPVWLGWLTGLNSADTFVMVLMFAVASSSTINAIFLRNIMRKHLGIVGTIDRDLIYKTLFVGILANGLSYILYSLLIHNLDFNGALFRYFVFILAMVANLLVTLYLSKKLELVEVYEYLISYLNKFNLFKKSLTR